MMTLLFGLYYLYKKSPKQKKSPKRSFTALKMNPILPSRVGGTRWLPHVQHQILPSRVGGTRWLPHVQHQILPSRVGGTRWLPHVQRAINAFVKRYKAIKMQLVTASHQNPKAEGLAVLMRNGGIISYMLILKVLLL
jgi:hypothetical protein